MTRTQRGPLAGIRVLELGSTVAGPFCGRLLADFGADVIKVEALDGDPVRAMGKRAEGVSLYAASLFRNKRLVALDLRTAEGQEIARRLALASDVVIENFRPGTLEKWGLGYDALSQANPGLVMVRISGYGQSGPYADRPGFGIIGEAVGGLRHVTGDADRPPSRAAISLTDNLAGLYGAFGALLALFARARGGRGQVVDSALYEAAFSLMEPHVPAYDKLGHVAGRAGSSLPGNAPNNLYPTADHRYVHIAGVGDPVFRRLAHAIGRDELTRDPRFSTGVVRAENAAALDDIVAGWTLALPLEAIEQVLRNAEVPATRIFTMADIFRDPHYAARGTIAEVPDDSLGTVRLAQVTPRLTGTPGEIRHAGRRVGTDTRTVLAEIGYAPEEINRLARSGVVALAEDAVRPAREAAR